MKPNSPAWRAALTLGVLLMQFACAGILAAAEATPEMVIDVVRNGGAFIVDALLIAPMPRRDAWAILTDFDGMSGFVPNLSASATTSR